MAVKDYKMDETLLTDPEVLAMTFEGYHVRRRQKDDYRDYLVIKDGTSAWYFYSLDDVKESWKEDWRGCHFWDVEVDP